ncbi:MAG: 3-hydroxybutyryl-CoA dehydrogenase [Chitinophagaceae bacterium]|nr:3-hydroxybutyryl-CoA dehydrogenase [Chitinophagaceae bacterium]
MKIGIIGSGTMGAGIAQVAATAGCQVVVHDQAQQVVDHAKKQLAITLEKLSSKGKLSEEQVKNTFSSIAWTTDLNALAGCELIIEAIVENPEIKQRVFAGLEAIVSEECILASNTSSLSITSLASACTRPGRFIGIHFFNPAPLMELVEIIPALQTTESTLQMAKSIIDSWGKKTVQVKDTPGFIVNRIARPYYSEAIRLYEEGFASLEIIDHAMKVEGGFRMGPFELMDMIGHDVNYTVTETVWKSFYFDPRYTPSFTQKRLVEAKWFGRKSGRGFYDYTQKEQQANLESHDSGLSQTLFKRILVMLINEAANAMYLHIASRDDIDLAMTKGVNYPKGLLAWADEQGIDHCVELLDQLYSEYHEDRYRCSPLLRRMKAGNQTFYP